MLKKSLIFLMALLCPFAFAQSTFSGPGMFANQTGTIGKRSGQDVDLKYFVNATGVHDTGLTPYAVTQQGTLVRPGALNGVELGLGAYGKHTFRRSQIGLDYAGNFRHYPNGSRFDGSNQQLNLEYIYQKSRKLDFDFMASAGTQNFGTAFGTISDLNQGVVNSSSLLFDNRTNYIQTSMETRYAFTNRTTVTLGGNYYTVHRQSSALVGVNGYALNGAINHQIGRDTNVGASYQHMHYDFPRAFGQADINTYTGDWSAKFGRYVEVALSGGVFISDVQGTQRTALDPQVAALFGISSVQTIFFTRNIMPVVRAKATRQFRRASLSGSYARSVTNGNGVYLTSRQETAMVSYSYTGFRRWSLSISGSTTKLDALGQDLVPYRQHVGSTYVNYNIGSGFNIVASYQRRYQDLQVNTFQRDSSRISIGVYFSPGSVPISFH